MHRIDGAGHVNNQFVNEDPATNRPPTEVTPEILNAFQEELCLLIEVAGIALNKNSNGQLLAALRSAGVFQTAAQFDTSTKSATCGFVKRALGGFAGLQGYSVATQLTGIDSGRLTEINAAVAMTLPLANTINSGDTVVLHSSADGASVARSGADVIYTGVGINTVTSLTLNQGEYLILVSNGNNAWYIGGGSAAYIYASPRFITAPQFDTSERAATAGFVKRALGGYRGIVGYSIATQLAAVDCGKLVEINAAVAMTLPAANTIGLGDAFILHATAGGASVARSGADVIYTGVGANSVTSLTLNQGESLVLVSNSSNCWYIAGGSAALKYSANFGASLAANGYQKLPSGRIEQQGTFTSSATPGGAVAVTFPIAFPNACRNVSITPLNPATNTTVGWFDTPSPTGFNGRCSVASVVCHYTAIGD